MKDEQNSSRMDPQNRKDQGQAQNKKKEQAQNKKGGQSQFCDRPHSVRREGGQDRGGSAA